jgi:hypothetical protein
MIGYLSPLPAQAMAEWPALGTCVEHHEHHRSHLLAMRLITFSFPQKSLMLLLYHIMLFFTTPRFSHLSGSCLLFSFRSGAPKSRDPWNGLQRPEQKSKFLSVVFRSIHDTVAKLLKDANEE